MFCCFVLRDETIQATVCESTSSLLSKISSADIARLVSTRSLPTGEAFWVFRGKKSKPNILTTFEGAVIAYILKL
jgi:hypothetical protein